MGPRHDMGSPEERDYVTLAREFQAKLHDAGFAGITVPKEYGGQGLTRAHQVAYSARSREVRRSPPVNTLGFGLFIPTLLAHGTEEQKKEWIPKVLRNEKIFCQLFSEPGAGSDLAGVQSKAERHDGEWILNGQKVWTSGAQIADIGGGPFRTDPDLPKHQGLSFFIVDMKQPGVEVRPMRPDHRRVALQRGVLHRRAGARRQRRRRHRRRLARVADDADERAHDARRWRRGPQRRGGGEGAIVRLARELGLFEDPEVARQGHRPLHPAARARRCSDSAWPTRPRDSRRDPEFSIMKLMGTRVGSKITELAREPRRCRVALRGRATTRSDAGGRSSCSASRVGKIAGGSDEILLNIIGERVLGLPQDPRVDKDVPFREIKVGTRKRRMT